MEKGCHDTYRTKKLKEQGKHALQSYLLAVKSAGCRWQGPSHFFRKCSSMQRLKYSTAHSKHCKRLRGRGQDMH